MTRVKVVTILVRVATMPARLEKRSMWITNRKSKRVPWDIQAKAKTKLETLWLKSKS